MATRATLVSEAVNNAEWQEFRKKLKGLSTSDKLSELEAYFELTMADCLEGKDNYDYLCIRVDNYLKALARGGQLFKGVSLEQALTEGGIAQLRIRKN